MQFFRPPFTDYLGSTDSEEGLSGPVDLPPGADQPDAVVQDDDVGPGSVQAVEVEYDNYLVEQSENECSKVGNRIYISSNFSIEPRASGYLIICY